ncbi:MAG TPA: hypothetical protein VNI54_12350 [Thermoanaerobaculia bacterium]|nr:hypothetical protein [Thermoanaerobaculia bacterium]
MAATAPQLSWQFGLLDPSSASRPAPTLVPPPPPVEPGAALAQVRATLEASVAARVRSGAELLRRAANNTEQLARIPTTLEAFDTLLGGGLERGKLLELVSRRAAGRFSIAMAALASSTSVGESAALIDLGDHFDPRLAEENGVDLRRLLWVRPRTVKEAVMSAELIVATGFQLVVIDLGLHPIKSRRAPDAAWVRLARTAETSRTAMLVSSPYPVTGTASEAVVKGSSGRAKWRRGLLIGVEMTLTLEKHRHMKPGGRSVVKLFVPEAPDVVGSQLSVLCGASVSGDAPQTTDNRQPTTRRGASR